jgi:hypothetical protein
MTKGTGLSGLPLLHIVADIFGAGVVFLLSAAFLRREQRLIEKLVATKDLSEKLIETLPGVFCIFDAEGNVRRSNRNFLGYPAAERFETGIFTTVAQESLEIARQVIKDAFENGSGETVAWLLGRNGAKVCCYLTGVRIIFENAPGVLEIAIAVSKGLRAQEDAKSQAATN